MNVDNKPIEKAVQDLLEIVQQLRAKYPHRRFTLDGRLVGDIGEVLAEHGYELQLNEGLSKHHDAMTADNRNVQIKSTMQKSLTFPADHVPEYYLGIPILPNGEYREIYNGPARAIANYLKDRKPPKNNLHNVSFNILRRLNESVDLRERIPERKTRPNPQKRI